MTGTISKRIALLKRIHSILLVLAILLSITATASGFFLFRKPDSEESAAPTISEPAEETTAPEETAAATETAVPEETSLPAETLVPDETLIPEETPIPEEVPIPEETADPSAAETIPHPDFSQLLPPSRSEEDLPSNYVSAHGMPPAAETTDSGAVVGEDPAEPSGDLPEDAQQQPAESIPTEATQIIPEDEMTEPAQQTQESPAAEETFPETTEATAVVSAEEEPPVTDAPQNEAEKPLWLMLVFTSSAGLLLADLVALGVISAKIRKLSRTRRRPTISYGVTEKKSGPGKNGLPAVGRAHNIGMRNYQQDSFGQIPILQDQGLLAVVADGMGGLSDGEKVSQRIVMTALDYGVKLTNMPTADTLVHMVNVINQDVNQMLGQENLFKSGSTLVATMVVQNHLWWASVGDSRIYLYRNGFLNQLTQDHDLLQEWMVEINRGRMSYEEAMANPDGRKLTSFIGMGKLRYIGYSNAPIRLQPGDRILLMSDGVYGTVSNDEMARILKNYPNVQDAADAVARNIEAAKRRHQDNYTIMILGM